MNTIDCTHDWMTCPCDRCSADRRGIAEQNRRRAEALAAWTTTTYEVTVGKRETRVRVTRAHLEECADTHDIAGPRSLRRVAEGVALERGVRKLYGARAWWSASHELPGFGQVTVYDPKISASHCLTPRVSADVTEL